MAEGIPKLIEPFAFSSDEINELVFVKLDGSYRGWKTELLVETIAKVEERLLLCKVCQGLLREASLFENEGRLELRCSLCLPKNVVTQKQIIIQESINEKIVQCPSKSKGCEWSDMLTQLVTHLDECPFVSLQCPLGCVAEGEEGDGEREVLRFDRRFLEEHQRMKCPMRQISCESCNSPIKACEMNKHLQTCDEYLVHCPNSCVGEEGATRAKRKAIPSHLEECPLQEVGCPYAEFGCGEKMERRLMDRHEKESMHSHFRITMLSMRNIHREHAVEIKAMGIAMIEEEKVIGNISKLTSNHKSEIRKLKEKVTHLENINHYQAVKIETLERSIFEEIKDEIDLRLSGVGSLKWEVTNVEDKIKNKINSYSEPFNIGFYKFQGNIEWGSLGRDKGYVSIYICIMRGNWDGTLKWPLRYKCKISLNNPINKAQNYFKMTEIRKEDLKKDSKCFQKPIALRNYGFGWSKFISHHELLENKYVKNDSIFLQINVEIITS